MMQHAHAHATLTARELAFALAVEGERSNIDRVGLVARLRELDDAEALSVLGEAPHRARYLMNVAKAGS